MERNNLLLSERKSSTCVCRNFNEASGEENSNPIHDELSKYFSKQEIAYITLAVAQINLWNRVVRSFGPTPGTYEVKQKVAESEMAGG
jgi:hypothetical protein